MEVEVYRCGQQESPLDLWHELLRSLDIDERAIGAWAIDRQFARDWNVRQLFRYGTATNSKAILAIRDALNDPAAAIYELEDLKGRGSIYVGVALTAIATRLVRR